MLTLREVMSEPVETPDHPEGEVRRGIAASAQRILARTVAISFVLAVLVGVAFGVWDLRNALDGVGGGTQTQDLFAVGVWGLLVLIEGRPRLAKPGKRARKKNSMSLSGFVVLNPILSALLTLAGLLTAAAPTAPPTLSVAVLSMAVTVWRSIQAVQVLRIRNAHFMSTARVSN